MLRPSDLHSVPCVKRVDQPMQSIRQPKVALRPTAVRPMLLANGKLLPYDNVSSG
jgi:hypothetical protein